MIQWNVKITPEFGEDLSSIHYYISVIKEEPINARKIVNNIIDSLQSLSCFPFRNPILNDANFNIRKMIINEFVILYLIEEETLTISVLRIFSTTKNYEKQFTN
ncbi:MAG: type II toxin-antitoxin system RelE/ParE family toxin [Bacilli bacterium]|nr:type II toxin-antitoxin system RelE/ParE family toxin [Bacilli bacterium]